MLVGGIVEAGAGRPGAVSAYVAYNPGPGQSRLFKVLGATDAPGVSELAAATTVNLAHFKDELAEDLAPALNEIAAHGGAPAITTPRPTWVAEVVRKFLREAEGLEVA